MRLRRLSFIAGWAAVVLLAAVGFAAFGTPDEPVPGGDIQAAATNMGHTTGAYAGLAFAYLAGNPDAEGFSTSSPDTPGEEDLLSGVSSRSESPPTTQAPTEVDASGWLSQIQVRTLASMYFDAADVNQAVRVAWCESRFNPSSVNLRTGGIGLFQHLPRYWSDRAQAAGFPDADPTDSEASMAAAAWAVYSGGGWDVFTCRG